MARRIHSLSEIVILLAGAAALCAIAVAAMGGDFLMAWAGDAVIHLRVAELLAGGHGFQFNLGEPVVATTSLLWSAVLAVFFRVFGPGGAVHAVKGLDLALWMSTVLVTAAAWTHLTQNRWIGWASAAVLALNPGVFQNSVNGMEAALAAFLQVTLFLLVFGEARLAHAVRLTVLVLLAVLVTLARPEGVVFCLLLAGVLAWHKRSLAEAVVLLVGTAMGAAVIAAINLAITGHVTPDSAVARMAAGLRESFFVGPIHIHPKSAVRLAVYLPVAIGLACAAAAAAGRRPLAMGRPALKSALGFSVLVVGSMLFFYTFVFGATQTSRYWTPFFPFVAGAACTGLALAYRGWREVRAARQSAGRRTLPRWSGAAIGIAMILWMAGVYGVEWRTRVREGPGYPHSFIASAQANRSTYTAQFLAMPGIAALDLPMPIRLAVTEVQSRYFLEDDGSVHILSLDGRTAPDFARFLDRRTGLRRFDKYLDEMQPDLIVLEQLHPAEPILPDLARALQEGSRAEIVIDGYRFVPVADYTVRYLHDD